MLNDSDSLKHNQPGFLLAHCESACPGFLDMQPSAVLRERPQLLVNRAMLGAAVSVQIHRSYYCSEMIYHAIS